VAYQHQLSRLANDIIRSLPPSDDLGDVHRLHHPEIAVKDMFFVAESAGEQEIRRLHIVVHDAAQGT
jgi:hypothetical protein